MPRILAWAAFCPLNGQFQCQAASFLNKRTPDRVEHRDYHAADTQRSLWPITPTALQPRPIERLPQKARMSL
jgi:hypothetical protein